MTSDQQRALENANDRAKKIHRMAGVAAFNGWSLGIFAAISIPFAFFSVSSAIITIGLGILAFNEFKGRRMIRAFDPGAGKLLVMNQIGLMTLLVGYGAWGLYKALTDPSPYAEYMNMGAGTEMIQNIEELRVIFSIAVYAGVIFFTLIFQGLNAWYYHRRGKMIQTYIDSTPGWILQFQRMIPGG